MEFRIADTFTASLARLTGDEQKAVKTTAFDLQMNPASPGMSFHKLDHAKDKCFWSIRVSADIRLIVHRTSTSLLLCYVDHHDKAYQWAERRKLETHPTTGAAQLVEIRERVKEVVVERFVEGQPLAKSKKKAKKPIFASRSDEELLAFGVPAEWLDDVRAADDDSLLALTDHLPAEAAEALLELATGGRPIEPRPVASTADPFAHPDAQRRFRVMADVEELARALEFPWDKWTTFLHPAQKQLVERDFAGPARVAGSAGTGKTIVALHRAVFLARQHPESRVLLTTFSESLASSLKTMLRRLVSNEPRIGERLEVHALNTIGLRLYQQRVGAVKVATPQQIVDALTACLPESTSSKLTPKFLLAEWNELVDAWQIADWESYRTAKRLGRKTRISETQRAEVWAVLERLRARLTEQGLSTHAAVFHRLSEELARAKNPPFEYVVLDEAQDVSVCQLRFLAALGGARKNALFFAGDLGQRIFQPPFSWKSLGVDVRGRSKTLHVNYRTSHQIRATADKLLGREVADVDGNVDDRTGTVSIFNGPAPIVQSFPSQEAEIEDVGRWVMDRLREGCAPHEIAIFVRSSEQKERAAKAALVAGQDVRVLDDHVDIVSRHVSVATMHLAKGLEFRAVAVMACDDDVVPLQERVETVTDETDLQEVYDTERHLLYVACTRARDHLLVCGVTPTSEFLDDLV